MRRFGPAIVLIGLGCAARPMHAQTAQSQSPPAADTTGTSASAAKKPGKDGVEDIVVTSQLRAQRLQNVPLSVTALSGRTLEQAHIENFADLAQFTPGFVAGQNYGFIRDASMRGISNNQFGFADDPSIAQFVDGVYQGRGGTGSQVNAFYDVNRVEVIKGPQATLFGRSSIAGAISTIDNQPTMGVFSGDAQIGTGEYRRLVAKGALNVPLSSDLAVRVAFDSESQEGTIKNLDGGPNLNPLDVKAARVIARYTGIAGLDTSLKFDFEERRQSGSVYGQLGLPPFTANISTKGGGTYSDFAIWDVAYKAKYRLLDSLNVTATTSYRRVGNQYQEKYDALPEIVGGPYQQHSNDKLFQQDVIFNYDTGRISAVAGASYFNEALDGFVSNFVNSGFAFTGLPTPGLLPDDYSLAFNEAGRVNGSFHGYSAFVDTTVEILPKLKLTGGVRYNYDKKTYTQDIANPATEAINAGKPFAGAYYNWGYYTGVPITSSKDWNNTSFRGVISYDVVPTLTTYASYNQGWKAGGIDSFKVATPAPFPLFFGLDAAAAGGKPNVYNPEHNESYELGAKGRFLDNRLGVNLALYHYVYRNLQESVPQGGSSIITNVGRAFGRGVEVETHYTPLDGWTLFANAAYNFTEIRSFPQIPDQVGQPLNFAPRWNGATGSTYRIETPTVWNGSVTLGGDVTFRTRYRTDNALIEGVKSQFLTNFRAIYRDGSGHYEAELFAENAFDRFTYSRYEQALVFLYPVDSRSVIGQPRMVGLDLRYHF